MISTTKSAARMITAVLTFLFPLPIFGAITVKTVPWVATNVLIPHDTFAGKAITLKGTSDVSGSNVQYAWDFGDGTPSQTGIVVSTGGPSGNNRRNWEVDAVHTYSGPVGTIFVARLTVTNTTTGDTGSQVYLVQMRAKSLSIETNVAVDEGLWYLHKTMNRAPLSGADVGDWLSCPSGFSCAASSSNYFGVTATNVNAFLVNGHREDGDPNNPYTETVARGMKRLFQLLTTTAIPLRRRVIPKEHSTPI